MLDDRLPGSRPEHELADSIEPLPPAKQGGAIGQPSAVVAALDRAWQDIRGRHEEVPPVVLLLGPSPSRRRARRRTLGYFAPLGWSARSDGASCLHAIAKSAVGTHEELDLLNAIDARTDAIVLNLPELYREMANTRGEVFIATELVARGAAEMFAVLLHEAAHTIAARRGIKDTSRQGRYHNGRFRTIAQETGLEGDRDAERGWSLTELSEAAKVDYRGTVAQLGDALAGRPGPQDRAAFAAMAGPICGCGQWVPLTRTRRPTIVAGTVMCDPCAERFSEDGLDEK